MSRHARDLLGMRFGRLVVISRAPASSTDWHAQWTCQCDCGKQKVSSSAHLGRGTRSCGCLAAERIKSQNVTHGMSRTRVYRIWRGMNSRCTNDRTASYPAYGGRGIGVCERWTRFEDFLADMGEPPAGLSLDRINNDGGYEPGNCRWATVRQQANNRRSNRILTLGNVTMNATQWASRLGISEKTLQTRLFRGWSVEKALRPVS